jgi:lipopolysaccharide transport system ATP-binding protein
MDDMEQPLFTFSSAQQYADFSLGKNRVSCSIPKGFLNVGRYYISLYVICNSKDTLAVFQNVLTFEVVFGTRDLGSWMQKEPGFIKPTFNWRHETY